MFLKLRKFKRINEPLLANKAKYIYQCYICYYKLPHSLQIVEEIFHHVFELQEFVGNLFDKLNYEKKIASNIENELKNIQQTANFLVLLFATCKLLIYPINPKSTINWNFYKTSKSFINSQWFHVSCKCCILCPTFYCLPAILRQKKNSIMINRIPCNSLLK